MQRWLRPVAVLLVLIAAGVGGWVFLTVRPVTVTVVAAERDVAIRIFGLGTVEARVLSRVGFEVGGALVGLSADHGDDVAEGARLAWLETGEQAARVARAEATVAVAEAALVRAEANLERAAAVLAEREAANRRQQELARRSCLMQVPASFLLRPIADTRSSDELETWRSSLKY